MAVVDVDEGAPRGNLNPVVLGVVEQPPALQKMKSNLTQMLADNPQTQRFNDIFRGVPRAAKGDPEVRPIETLRTFAGFDFYFKVFLTGVYGFIFSYITIVAVGLILSLINMATGSCGQDTWKTDASEACQKMIMKPLVLGMETRCLGDKPPNMLQKDFDETCGFPVFVVLAGVCFLGLMCHTVKKLLMALFVKVNFYQEFFTVESWSGVKFEASFYADVTHARISTFGLKLKSKAKAALNAGGADDDKGKKGQTLKILEDSEIAILAGSDRQKYAETLAKYLPVGIDGSSGTTTAPLSAQSSASLLEGRMKEILDTRKANKQSFKFARLPYTCDFLLEIMIIIVIVMVIWYIGSTFFSFIFWAITKGQNKCTDPLRPGADMCAVWRIFTPIDIPLVAASNYINLVTAIIGILAVPGFTVAGKAMEYRLHQNGAMQETLLAGQEWQENFVFFPEDCESYEVKKTSLGEPVVEMQAKAHYLIKGGISSKFIVTANFRSKGLKLSLPDVNPSVCTCHKQKAIDYKEKLLALVDEFKARASAP